MAESGGTDAGPVAPKWGFSLISEDLGAAALVELGVLAEQEGYTDLWGFEAGGYDGVAPLAAALQATERVRVGSGVLNVYSRTPLTLAMTASFLAELSGGRFCLGLGASSSKIIGDWHGVPFERPYTRVREVTEAVQTLLAGDRADMEGHTVRLTGARLGLPPRQAAPVWLAGLGPRMLRLAGEVADGLVLTLTGPGVAGALAAEARAAADAAGRGRLEVVHRPVMAYPGDDPAALGRARQLLADYCLVPVYRNMFSRFGFGADVDDIDEARGHGGRGAARDAVRDELLAEFTIVGSPEEQYQRLLEFEENGIDVPLVSLYPGADDPGERRAVVEEGLRWFARRRARDTGARTFAEPGAAQTAAPPST